jgi:hypothetical protein
MNEYFDFPIFLGMFNVIQLIPVPSRHRDGSFGSKLCDSEII